MNESFPRFESGRMRAYRTSRAGLAALLIALPLAGFAPLAHAERADKDKPLNIEADNMTYDDLKQVNIFTGHVVATKGTIVIKADRVEVTQDPQGYQYATGTSTGKNLAYFRQKRDGSDEYIDGDAERIDYDGKHVAGPGNPNGRVRAMLSPRNGGAQPISGPSATLQPTNQFQGQGTTKP